MKNVFNNVPTWERRILSRKISTSIRIITSRIYLPLIVNSDHQYIPGSNPYWNKQASTTSSTLDGDFSYERHASRVKNSRGLNQPGIKVLRRQYNKFYREGTTDKKCLLFSLAGERARVERLKIARESRVLPATAKFVKNFYTCTGRNFFNPSPYVSIVKSRLLLLLLLDNVLSNFYDFFK